MTTNEFIKWILVSGSKLEDSRSFWKYSSKWISEPARSGKKQIRSLCL